MYVAYNLSESSGTHLNSRNSVPGNMENMNGDIHESPSSSKVIILLTR